MVTQDSHSPVCPVVGQDLGWNVVLPLRKTEYNEFPVCRIIHDSRHPDEKPIMNTKQVNQMDTISVSRILVSWFLIL